MDKCDLELAKYIFGGVTMEHDLRKIPRKSRHGSRSLGGEAVSLGIDLQCLHCGSVFRSKSLNMALALIDCEEEKTNREDILLDSLPMMVSPTSEKYDATSKEDQ